MSTDFPAIEKQARQLLAEQRLEAAEALLRPLVAADNVPLVFWKLLAAAIRPQGKIAETRAIQEMLVAKVPGDFVERFNLAELLLMQGEFERGWREYGFRYRMPHTQALGRRISAPRWRGQPIAGKTLFIHDEQGYGDSFQFLRLAEVARQRSGARIVLEVDPDILPLARRCQGYDVITGRGQLPPPFDCHCELMGLPQILGLTLADLPGAVSYLSPDADRVTRWRQRLAALPRPLVALVWAGRPTHSNDVNRSMKLAQLAPLGRAAASFVSLQKGPAAQEAATPPEGLRVLPLGDEITDFEDTAAILSMCDVLISVDSSPVHLAGALGVPAWVLLPRTPDWRWLLDRPDTPWYPSVRLYRQPRHQDWLAPIEQAAADLTALVAAR